MKETRLDFRVSTDVKDKLMREAAIRGVTMSDIVTELVDTLPDDAPSDELDVHEWALYGGGYPTGIPCDWCVPADQKPALRVIRDRMLAERLAKTE